MPKPDSPAKPDVEAAQEAVQQGLVSACANLLTAFKAQEEFIKTLEQELDATRKVNQALHQKITLLEQIATSKTKETEALREALALKDSALAEYKTALDLTKKEVERQKKNGNRKLKAGFVAGLVVGIGLKLLF